jgi:hypothetical protein
LKVREENSTALSNLTDWSQCSGEFAFNLMTYAINLAKAWIHVDRKHKCDHLVDASIKTIKYLNGSDNGFIGPQISPWIHLTNLSGSTLILIGDGLKINFPVAQAMHIKSKLGNLTDFKLWQELLPIIFLIIPTSRCPRRSCQVVNASTF